MASFFVPHVEPDKQEEAYRELAKFVGAATPELANRVYSITWRHDGIEWTATVGEHLKGTETITKGRGRSRREFTVPRTSSDTVLAIYPGVPFLIAHDCRSRTWNLPILAGNPLRVVRFSD